MHKVPHSKKTKKLISSKLKGHSYHTFSSRKKISIAMRNRVINKETRKKLSIINTGKHHSEKTKNKLSIHMKNFCKTRNGKIRMRKLRKSLGRSDVRQKMSNARKGRSYEEIYGKKEALRQKKLRSKQFAKFPIAKRIEIGKKISQKIKKSFTPRKRRRYSVMFSGERSPSWRGGKSFEEYTRDWTTTLRRAIRERDEYRCRDCGNPQEDYAFDVHHKDGNKKNCKLGNLITLCRPCHQHRHGTEMRLKCVK